jgi:uncharacterized protein (TIGR00255 family)
VIQSMTAFARRESKVPQGALTWELRTFNHRYLEVSLRLPEEFRSLESGARELIAARLRRGKLEGTLRFHGSDAEPPEFAVNEALIKKVLDLHERVEGMMRNPARCSSTDILKWPNVLRTVEPDYASVHQEAMRLLESTLDDLVQSRAREGHTIKALIESRLNEIRRHVDSVRSRMPSIIEAYRGKLRSRLDDLGAVFDAGRLEQELLYMVQKSDVAEELDRLVVHLQEVQRVLGEEGTVGRRLDFLMQELNREANTLGSKSIDASTTLASVEIKVAIEQMREQIQNVE